MKAKVISISLVVAAAVANCAAATAEDEKHVVEDFAWTDPFGGREAPAGFEATCTATRTFRARQHLLGELQKPEPLGLAPWAKALKYFFGGRPFPGSWDGVDAHGVARDVMLMNYTDMPDAVKVWAQQRAADEGRWLFGVYHKNKNGIKIQATATPRPRPTAVGGKDKDGGEEALDVEAARLPPDEDLVVIFAAGAVYRNLPLWVAAGSACEAELMDLDRYSATPRDGSVAAWVVERTEPDLESDSREMTFTVKAQVLRETEESRRLRLQGEDEDGMEATATATAKDEL